MTDSPPQKQTPIHTSANPPTSQPTACNTQSFYAIPPIASPSRNQAVPPKCSTTCAPATPPQCIVRPRPSRVATRRSPRPPPLCAMLSSPPPAHAQALRSPRRCITCICGICRVDTVRSPFLSFAWSCTMSERLRVAGRACCCAC